MSQNKRLTRSATKVRQPEPIENLGTSKKKSKASFSTDINVYNDTSKIIMSYLLDILISELYEDEIRNRINELFLSNKSFGRLLVETMIKKGHITYVLCLIPFAVENLKMNNAFVVSCTPGVFIKFPAIKKYHSLLAYRYTTQEHVEFKFDTPMLSLVNLVPKGCHSVIKFVEHQTIQCLRLEGDFGQNYDQIKEGLAHIGTDFGDWTKVNLTELQIEIFGFWPGMLGLVPKVETLKLLLTVYGETWQLLAPGTELDGLSKINKRKLGLNFPSVKHLTITAGNCEDASSRFRDLGLSFFYSNHFMDITSKLDSLEFYVIQHKKMKRHFTELAFYGQEIGKLPKNLTIGRGIKLDPEIDPQTIDSLTCYVEGLQSNLSVSILPKKFVPIFTRDIEPEDLNSLYSNVGSWILAGDINIVPEMKEGRKPSKYLKAFESWARDFALENKKSVILK